MEVKKKTKKNPANKTLRKCYLNILAHNLLILFKIPNHYHSPRTNSEISYFSVALSFCSGSTPESLKSLLSIIKQSAWWLILVHISPIHPFYSVSIHYPSGAFYSETSTLQCVSVPILQTCVKINVLIYTYHL